MVTIETRRMLETIFVVEEEHAEDAVTCCSAAGTQLLVKCKPPRGGRFPRWITVEFKDYYEVSARIDSARAANNPRRASNKRTAEARFNH